MPAPLALTQLSASVLLLFLHFYPSFHAGWLCPLFVSHTANYRTRCSGSYRVAFDSGTGSENDKREFRRKLAGRLVLSSAIRANIFGVILFSEAGSRSCYPWKMLSAIWEWIMKREKLRWKDSEIIGTKICFICICIDSLTLDISISPVWLIRNLMLRVQKL